MSSLCLKSNSVVLISPTAEVSSEGKFRVALLKRRAQGSFKNAYVFAGGNVDEADAAESWNTVLPPILSDSERKDRMLRLAAIREVFEECGILLEEGSSHLPLDDVLTWRERVHSDASAFIDLFQHRSSRPAVNSLALWSNWITPRSQPRRWDTYFYLCLLHRTEGRSFRDQSALSANGPEQALVLSPDGKEIMEAHWLAPTEALRRAFSGEIKLLPPQVYTLGSLPDDWRQLLQEGSDRLLKSCPAPQWEPLVTAVNDGEHMATLLPGDAEHPYAASKNPNARHRNYLSGEALAKRNFVVLGSHRQGMISYLGEWAHDFAVGETYSRAKSRM